MIRDPNHPDLFDDPLGRARDARVPDASTSADVVAFPLDRRIGKIRDVARKLVATKSERHSESYRRQVAAALEANLIGRGVSPEQVVGDLVRFWRCVELEAARLVRAE